MNLEVRVLFAHLFISFVQVRDYLQSKAIATLENRGLAGLFTADPLNFGLAFLQRLVT